MGQEFQLWAERPRRQSWSPAKRVWNICWGGNDCCSNLLSEFLKYQVLGFPLGLRPSNNSHPVKTRSTGWTISNTMIATTNSVQGHLLCASVGRIGGSCTGKPPPPSTPTTPLLTAPPGWGGVGGGLAVGELLASSSCIPVNSTRSQQSTSAPALPSMSAWGCRLEAVLIYLLTLPKHPHDHFRSPRPWEPSFIAIFQWTERRQCYLSVTP